MSPTLVNDSWTQWHDQRTFPEIAFLANLKGMVTKITTNFNSQPPLDLAFPRDINSILFDPSFETAEEFDGIDEESDDEQCNLPKLNLRCK